MFEELFTEIEAAQAEMSAWRRRLTGADNPLDRAIWSAARARLGESQRRWLAEGRPRVARLGPSEAPQHLLAAPH
jgi:hypothetical protein